MSSEPALPPAPAVLAISSEVAYGAVGSTAASAALRALGLEVLQLPTVVLSNHPGLGPPKGLRVPAADLAAMLERLEQGGWLKDLAGVLTGYFVHEDQVAAAAATIARLKAAEPGLVYVCDPVLGDAHTGLYVPEPVAAAIRDRLVPLADAITPNWFELGWISGRTSREFSGFTRVLATSAPAADGRIATVLSGVGTMPLSVETRRRDRVPHGTGDLLAGLFLGGLVCGRSGAAALGRAMGALERMIDLSAGCPVLDLADGLKRLDLVAPAEVLADGKPPRVAGVDGCPAGWLAVLWDGLPDSTPEVTILDRFEKVLDLPTTVIGVDMPIGLPDRYSHGGRPADRLARARLGERQSSVFPAPCRAALAAATYQEACDLNRAHSDPPAAISIHCYNILDKMREVDGCIGPRDQVRVFEVHPELSFWAMNGGAVPLAKKVKGSPHAPGLELRRGLLEAKGFPVSRLPARAFRASQAGPDDLIDACAAAWSARRLRDGEEVRLPERPMRDARGLRMEICA